MCFLGDVQCYVPKQVKRLENPSQNPKANKVSKQEVKVPSVLLDTKGVSAKPVWDGSLKTKGEREWTYLQFHASDASAATSNSKLPPMGKNMALNLMKSEKLHEMWDGWLMAISTIPHLRLRKTHGSLVYGFYNRTIVHIHDLGGVWHI